MDTLRIQISIISFVVAVLAQPASGDIVINEIHYDPVDNTSPEEFIELYNTETYAVDLGGAYFDNGVTYTFPPGTTIDAESYLVIAQDPSRMLARFGVTAWGPYIGTLKNSGEKVRLRNASDITLDTVDYSDHFPWPTQAGGAGNSMELIHHGLDNNLGASWRSSSFPDAAPAMTFVAAGSSSWTYRKGTSEPPADWMTTSFVTNATWLPGTTSIGYADGDDATLLSDMQNNYSTIYLRHNFVVDNAAQITGQGTLSHYLDDGAIVYLNGVEVTRLNVTPGDRSYDGLSGVGIGEASWQAYSIADLSAYLVVGTNTLALHVLNSALNSSDLSIDIELKTTDAPSLLSEPTPGAANSVGVASVSDAPPAIRQVDHSPKQPLSAEPVLITAKVTDPDGVQSVTLHYQVVEPGNYIRNQYFDANNVWVADPDYETGWVEVSMLDNGADGDALAGDSIYTVRIPGSTQTHRRLIRYRITVEDTAANSVQVPYADDQQVNFAYFVYDGVPAWSGAIEPGVSSPVTYSAEVMNSLPVYHILARPEDVEECQYEYIQFQSPEASLYQWTGALVYDGVVYDHVRFRIRGWWSAYEWGKNKWKFDFNRGRELKAHDNYGQRYERDWSKLNFSFCISMHDYNGGNRGEDGMFEAVGFKLFNLAGVPASRTHWLQLRVIDDADEAPANQYEGDFWGMYMALEQVDGRFLDEHNLPDGNIIKDASNVNNQSATQPLYDTDLAAFESAYKTNPDQQWWQANTALESYYGYRTLMHAMHHYDARENQNCVRYHNSETDQWYMMPWDIDLSWDNAAYASGTREIWDPYLDAGWPQWRTHYYNRMRELQDLLLNTDQTGQLIDELAAMIADPAGGPSIRGADRAKWDYNPLVDTTSDSYYRQAPADRRGKFYTHSSLDTPDFAGMVQKMKDYIALTGDGGSRITGMMADSAIPDMPAITYTGAAGYPLNGLSFQCDAFSDPQGSGTFAAMEWRAGEVLDETAPSYDPTQPPPYEITAKWESGELASYNSSITIPSEALKVGHAYRVRVRMKDDTDRWSHWSVPVEFVVDESSTAGALVSHLRITEVMYDSPGGSDFEFVELHNTSTNQTLELGGAAFTEGIDYNFPGGTTIAPGGYLLIIGNADSAAFRTYYGLDGGVPVAGPYSGKLSDGGEELRLKTAPGGSEIAEFGYGNGRTWPLAAAGAGHSLVPINPTASGQATGALDYPGNWRASTFMGGSPGADDPIPPALSVVLNEIAAHTDYTANPEYDSNDWIELHNNSGSSISLADWYLSDDPSDPKKWAIPAVSIPAGGYKVFNEVDDFHSPITSGFGLDKAGEQVLLSYLPGTAADRVVDAIGFKGQENGHSLSRYPNGTGYWYATDLSSAVANTAPLPGLRLTEVMYQPPLLAGLDNVRDEFVEILNPTASDVTMQNVDEAWRLNGGIEYTFPDNTVLSAGERLLVVSFDPTDTITKDAFLAAYSIPGSPQLFGPYTGKLGNRSDRVTLEKPQFPDAVGDAYSWVIEDETIYGNQNPWPASAAGSGPSLERISMSQHGLDPANWHAGPPTPDSESSDRDGDGMPSDWETAHGLDPDNPADAAVDSDGDGFTNLEEYWSGTDPQDPESFLTFDWIGPTNAMIGLRFIAVADKTYTIQHRLDLETGAWQILTNLGAAVSTESVNLTDPATATNNAGFYRIITPSL